MKTILLYEVGDEVELIADHKELKAGFVTTVTSCSFPSDFAKFRQQLVIKTKDAEGGKEAEYCIVDESMVKPYNPVHQYTRRLTTEEMLIAREKYALNHETLKGRYDPKTGILESIRDTFDKNSQDQLDSLKKGSDLFDSFINK